MALFDRFFGKGRKEDAARSAELRGELPRAVELFVEAGLPGEAARVMILRAEGEPDARARLLHYTQAGKLAPEGTETNTTARLRRAELLLALAGDAAVSAVARHEIAEAARDLEAIGEPLKAAEAYARAGDKEGEARALQAAGDVERLEFLLATQQHEERVSRAREDRVKDVDLLIGCGRRREALAGLDELQAGDRPSDPDESHRSLAEAAALRDRANGLRARMVKGPVVALEIGGERWTFVLGSEVVVGRTEGAIKVPSNAVSRQHLRVWREGGEIMVRDLESRNGTQLRGINLAGPIPTREGLELKLGREVPTRIAPRAAAAGSTEATWAEIRVAGETYVAPLGPGLLPIPDLELFAGADGWVELVAKSRPVYLGSVELVPRATLLVGDAISTSRGAPPALRVLGT